VPYNTSPLLLKIEGPYMNGIENLCLALFKEKEALASSLLRIGWD